MSHPRDRFITVFGRKPVLAAVEDPQVPVQKILLAHTARGPVIKAITRAAKQRAIGIERVSPKQVNRISRNARQDQGAVADVAAPRMGALADRLAETDGPATVLLLDGVTTPANVGMILRSATGAGLEGVVLPRRGSPEVGPLVIKASAGVAFVAPIWRAPTALEAARALKTAGFALIGLAGEAPAPLHRAHWPERAAFVMGNETAGISAAVRAELTDTVSIPMANGVESLNVAAAATVIAFEVQRRRLR